MAAIGVSSLLAIYIYLISLDGKLIFVIFLLPPVVLEETFSCVEVVM